MGLFKLFFYLPGFIFFILLTLSSGWCADWIYYYQAEKEIDNKIYIEKHYFDNSSIEKPQKGIVVATQKIAMALGGVEENLKDKKILQVEINCSKLKFRILKTMEYDDAGREISAGAVQEPKWSDVNMIAPIGALYDNVCYEKKVKKEKKKEPEKGDKETTKAEKQKEDVNKEKKP